MQRMHPLASLSANPLFNRGAISFSWIFSFIIVRFNALFLHSLQIVRSCSSILARFKALLCFATVKRIYNCLLWKGSMTHQSTDLWNFNHLVVFHHGWSEHCLEWMSLCRCRASVTLGTVQSWETLMSCKAFYKHEKLQCGIRCSC